MSKRARDPTPSELPLPDALERALAEARDEERARGPDAALRVLEAAPEALACFGSFQYARGALLVRIGQLDEGIAALEEACALEPEVPEVASNLGAALLSRAQAGGPEGLSSEAAQRDLERALEVLEAAARQAPKLADVYANLGRALTLKGQLPAALLAFDRGLALDEAHVPTLYNKAAALHALGDDESSLACLEGILAVAPGFAPARESRERALRRLGRI